MGNVSTYLMPTKIVHGEGSSKLITQFIRELSDGKHVLIVLDQDVCKIGVADYIIEQIKEDGYDVTVFSEVPPDPNELVVERGLNSIGDKSVDVIVAIGGGSTICVAKGIGVVLTNGGQLSDWQNGTNQYPPTPIIAMPTTAGAGTEVAPRFMIKNSKTGINMRLGGANCYPKIAVLEPELLLKLPERGAIGSSIDALCHAIEAYTSTEATPLTDAIALQAIKNIYKHMAIAACTESIESRHQMLLAACMANIACGNAKLGLPHNLTYGKFGVSHGYANGLVLIPCLEFILPTCKEKMSEMATVMGKKLTGDLSSDAHLVIDAIKELFADLKVPRSLKEIGLSEDYISELVNQSVDRIHVKTSARWATRSQMEDIFKAAYQGW